MSETSGRYRRCGGAALKTAMTTYSFNYSVLDDPAAAGATVAFGINSLGQIVGYYLGGDAKNHGFLYSSGTYSSIDDPAISEFTVATGINDSGQIAPALVPAQQAGQSLRARWIVRL